MTGTIVDVEIPAEQFVLEHTLETLQTITFEVEQLVATSDGRLMPFIWVDGTDRTAIEEAFTTDDTVADFQLIAEFDTDCLYQLGWIERTEPLLHMLVEEKGTVLSATGEDDTWYLRLLFTDRDAVTRTHEYCLDRGIDLGFKNIQNFGETHRDRFGLTDSQKTTVRLAYERGYYSVPREATADDLSNELGISHQAVSERLRRGHGSLAEHVLVNGTGTPAEPDPPESSESDQADSQKESSHD